MKTEQWLGQALMDEDSKARYEEYLRYRDAKKERSRKGNVLALGVALLCTAVAVVLWGSSGLLAFPLVWIAVFLITLRKHTPVDQAFFQRWKDSGVQLIASAVSACFEDGRVVRESCAVESFRGIIKADSADCALLFAGIWRGKRFGVCHVTMHDEAGDDYTKVFDGVLLEVEASPALDDEMQVRLSDGSGYQILPDADRTVSDARRERSQRFFSRGWMTRLSDVAHVSTAFACVRRAQGHKRIVQVAMDGLSTISFLPSTLPYEEFVRDIEIHLRKVQQMLDVIMDNQLLFDEQA